MGTGFVNRRRDFSGNNILVFIIKQLTKQVNQVNINQKTKDSHLWIIGFKFFKPRDKAQILESLMNELLRFLLSFGISHVMSAMVEMFQESQ